MRQLSSTVLTLMVVCIAVNMIGGQIVSLVKLPIFLDSIGTMLAGVLAGPMIGMVTGLLTNLIWGLISGPVAAAFAPVSMVIGLTAGLMARAGWFRSVPRVVVSGIVITIALTIVAVPIRVYLFGGVTGSGADFLVAYMAAVGQKLMQSVAVTVIGANLVDKIITALIVWALVWQMPERTRSRFPNAAPVR